MVKRPKCPYCHIAGNRLSYVESTGRKDGSTVSISSPYWICKKCKRLVGID